MGGGRTEHQPGWQPDTSLFLIFCFFFIPSFSSYLFFSIFSLEYIKTLFPQLLLHFAGTYALEWNPGFVSTHSISLLQWAILIPANNDISDPSDKDEVESKQLGRQGGGLQSGSCALWTSLFGDDGGGGEDGGEDGNVHLWVSFCRAGIMAVLRHFFLKVEPPCDQT